MAKFSGTLDKPFETPLWNKPTDQVFVGSQPIPSNPDGTVPGYWIVSTYQESAGILAFIHVEHPNLTRDVYDTGRTRIGLAWSADNGEHFAYLGDAIIPNTDPEAGFNIVGAPYLIKDGYFYIYFKDACGNAVARASVSDVITAAKKGKITPWMKYKSGSWNSPGLGGVCTSISIMPDGTNHTAAAYSTYTGMYYLLLSTMNWGGQNTWIKLFRSSDGIYWTMVKTIVDEPGNAVQEGYQYVTIADADGGASNGTVGRKFYIYSAKEPYTGAVVHGWLVDLGGTVESPTVSLAANGQSNLTIVVGDSYTIDWNSSNVSSCTLSYMPSDGNPGSSFSIMQ